MNWMWTLLFLHFGLINAKDNDIAKGPPYLIGERRSQKKSVEVGKDIKLTCPIRGNPDPIYEWWKDNSSLQEDAWQRVRVQKNSLKIKDAAPEDRGAYSCKGVNGFGQEQFVFYLHVQASLGSALASGTGSELKVEQVFPLSGSTITKLTGQSVGFKCFITGDPPPDVSWYKDGYLLNPSKFAKEPQDEAVTKYFLHLSQLTPRDAGNYSCEVMNVHGAVSVNWTLNVAPEVPEEKGVSGAVPLQLFNLTSLSGEDAVLRCKGTWDSEISPKVKWLRQIDSFHLHKIPENETFPYKGKYYQVLQPTELSVLEEGFFLTKLVIRSVQSHDTGVYVCTATNRYGLHFKEAYLAVIDRHANYGHLIMVVSLSLMVFLIVTIVVVVTLRKKKAKRLPPQKPAIMPEHSRKLQMEAYCRPLITHPDRAEPQPRYIIFPPTHAPPISTHFQSTDISTQDAGSRLHPNLSGHLTACTSQGSDGSNHGPPLIVCPDNPRSMYLNSNKAYRMQSFEVV